MLKRCFDTVCSAVGILALSPILLLLAITIKLGSEGPIFYCGKRAGRYGKPFSILKFRSMVPNAEQLGGPSTSEKDHRITNVGKFMRRMKLDELPQLLNVLRGEMSLVGPRPQVLDYVAQYTEEEKAALQIRPGITDWASIWNSDEGRILAGSPDPDKAYDELIHPTKMKLQMAYAKHNSVWVDLKIIAYTLFGLVCRDWVPPEIREYPKPGKEDVEDLLSFGSVTELPGAAVNSEQLKMLHTRYGWAGDFVEDKDVLEVACGSGIGLGHLAAKAERVVGCDYDPAIAQFAERQYKGHVEVDVADAQSLPYSDSSFDVVILFEAIYYLERPELFVQEAHRVLRPNGTLLVCSANCERPDFNFSPFSIMYFSARKLQYLLGSNGFNTTIQVGFSIQQQGWKSQIRQMCRTIAVKLRLIPKTMKWKSRVKRLFFGKLQSLPAVLGHHLTEREALTQVEATKPINNYKVIYAVGTRKTITNHIAA